MMKRSMVAMAVAGAMSFAANAADVNGFADIRMNADNEAYQFGAAGEVDFSASQDGVSVRVDVDLAMAADDGNGGGNSLNGESGVIEQAFFAAPVASGVTLVGGLFNNPVGMEAQDVTDRNTMSSGMIYGIFDNQTVMYGNNVAGLAAAIDAGMAKVTVGFLNDIGGNPDSAGKAVNSIAVVVNASVMEGLDVELGHVTQEAGAGAVTDINLTYAAGPAKVGFEYLMAEELVDSAIGLNVGYDVMPGLGVALRYETMTPAGGDDETNTTLAATYAMAKNLDAVVEYTSYDDGVDTDASGVIGFVAKF